MNPKEVEKLLGQKCQICNFNRYVERCHIIPKSLGAGLTDMNTFYFCPNHHKLFDYGLLNKEELMHIEHYLIALTDIYREDLEKLNYLYFQLRLTNNPPKHLGGLRVKHLKKDIQNQYFIDH